MVRILNNADITETTALDHNTKEWVYNGLDCCVTYEIRDELVSLLDDTTRKTYDFALALQGPILEMSMNGILIDEVHRQKTLTLYREQILRLEDQLTQIVRDGMGIDLPLPILNKKTGKSSVWWRSPARLQNLFYDVMGLNPVRKRNAQGRMAPTVNREAMEKLGALYFSAEPICAHILALRDIDKKRGFLETGIDPDGRMRSNYNIAGTNTGRLSSSVSDFGTGTNNQNVDRDLRYTFVADPGYVFVNLDGEQADARNVGAICWNLFVDKFGPAIAGAYLDACESGDLHTTVCKMAWRDLDWGPDVSNYRTVADLIAYRNLTYRDLAKKLGHGTNYYGQPHTMAKHTKVEKNLIQDFQFRYFEGFPAIKMWHQWVRDQLTSVSYLTTMMGRRRSFFGRSYEDETLREAIAYEPQSMTADEIDQGMLQMWREAKRWGANRVRLNGQVHDSTLWQVPVEIVNEFVPWALKTKAVNITLKQGRNFTVPLEAKVGYNWGDYDPREPDLNPDGLRKWKGKLAVERHHLYTPQRKLLIIGR